MVVRSAGYDAQAAFFQFGGKGLRVGDDLPDVFLVSGLHGFLEADGLGSDDVHQGAALNAGEYLPVDFGGIGFLAENHAAARAAQGFMRGGGDKVGVGRGVGMKARGDEARKVGHIHHEQRADGVGNFAQALEVENARVGAGAGANQFGFVFVGEFFNDVVINALGLRVHAVGHDVEEAAGEIDFVAVGEVSAVVEAHGEHGVAGFHHGEIDRHVGRAAAVRLHIGVFGAEKLFGAVNGQLFGIVHEFTAVVVATAGVALGVFVGQHGALSFAHGAADVVFGGNQLNVLPLADGLALQSVIHFGVALANGFRLRDAHRAGVHLLHAPLVAGARLKGGIEPGLQNVRNFFHGRNGGAQRHDVGVVVLARHAGHFGVENLRRAHAGEFVGGHAHADAGRANQEALVERTF